MRLVAASDIALSVICSDRDTHNDALRGVITTKIFDYLILGKDVLNIVPEDFEFNLLASDVGLVGLKNYQPGDIDGIARFLREKLEIKLSPGNHATGNGVGTLSVAWTRQMEKLDALLMDLVR